MELSTFNILKHQNNKAGVQIEGALLKDLQKTMLSILKDFDSVCSKHNLYYSLCGGSALGAVRHKGFIPWDDDIDVFMTRESWNKFLQIFNESLGEKYTLHSPETTPELGMPIAQLSLNGTIYRTHLAPNRNNPGVYLDIFILENVSNNAFFRTLHGFLSLLFGFCLSCSRYYKDREIILNFFSDSDPKTLKSLRTKIFLGKILNCFSSSRFWSVWTNKINMLCKNIHSNYVSCPSGRGHFFKETYERSKICMNQTVLFENMPLKLMKDPSYYLNRLYGSDYMQIPDVDKREKHCIIECKN